MGDFEVFIGEYRHNIDTKGRLSIPAKMRLECGEKVYVTRGNEGCLAIYTVEGWENYYQSLMTLPKRKAEVRTFIRLVTSRATDCEFDKLGRINIPLVLRKEGNLQNKEPRARLTSRGAALTITGEDQSGPCCARKIT